MFDLALGHRAEGPHSFLPARLGNVVG